MHRHHLPDLAPIWRTPGYAAMRLNSTCAGTW